MEGDNDPKDQVILNPINNDKNKFHLQENDINVLCGNGNNENINQDEKKIQKMMN